MMGWGWSKFEHHLPPREMEDDGYLILVVCGVMAFMLGTSNNPLFNFRNDSQHCKMIQPSGKLIAGPRLWILRYSRDIMDNFIDMAEVPMPIAQNCSPDAGISFK